VAEQDPVVKAVIDAYYPDYVHRPSAARTRAQGAYTIAGAVAAAIVAAGIAGNIAAGSCLVQAFGAAALAAWLITACLFILAVAVSVERPSSEKTTDRDTFLKNVFDQVDREQGAIEKRLKAAFWSTLVALALTFASVVIALAVPRPSSEVHGRLSLTSEGRSAIEALCGRSPDTVAGSVDPAALGNAFTVLRLDAGMCGRQAYKVSLARASIEAFAADQ
jgi:MFS family permease